MKNDQEYIALDLALRLLDIAPGSVDRLVREGKLVRGEPGYVSVESVRTYVQGLRTQAARREDTPGLTEARARKEAAIAGIKELELEELEGSMVRIVDVQTEAFNTGRKVRDSLLAVGSRISAILASTTDQGEVERILEAEHRQVLEQLATPEPPQETPVE